VVLRRITFPLRLVGARLGAGGERLALVALGIVAGAAVLAAVLAGRLVMQDRALQLAVGQLQPGDRTVQVVWSGAVTSFGQLDPQVTPKVEALTGETPVAAMLFREASIQQRLVNVRAADDLNKWVTLDSGRLPKPCVPSHCEVLRLKGTGPIPATKYALSKTGMSADDIDLVEINEAFASVVAAWRRELEPDMDRVNVNGGAIAIGHPIGASGARVLTTLLFEMQKRDAKTGLATLCIGGGMGIAMCVER